MARLKCIAHDMNVACRVKRIIQSAIGDRDEVIDDRRASRERSRVDKLGCTEFGRPSFFIRVRVDGDDS